MDIISISQLTVYIKEKLESDMVLSNLWVRGEISNFKHHSSGHMYFTLKDKTSALRCIMFRSRNQQLTFVPRDGMGIIARGYVTVYERDGQYQLYVEEMQPDGIGALYTAYLQLKEKLEYEGLFEQARKKTLPVFPHKVGVVTSPTGAAIRDIITVMTRRYPRTHIIIIPVAVQGENAPAQIAEGIKLANILGDIDVLIVGRGGGSIEELWAFNTEIVARSIYASAIPVVSAVGHETDFTIADFVADKRAATPSAAAELVVPDYREVQKYLSNLKQRIISDVQNNISTYRERLSRVKESNPIKRPKENLYKSMQELDYLIKSLSQAAVGTMNDKKNRLTLQMSRLDDLSPLSTMKRGYAICRNSQGLVIKKAAQLTKGENVELVLQDGSVDCTVEKVEEGSCG